MSNFQKVQEFNTAFGMNRQVTEDQLFDDSPESKSLLKLRLDLITEEVGELKEAIETHNKVLTIMGNVIANNPGQISELSRRSALYRARAYETRGLQLLRQNKKDEAKGNFRIAIKIFDRTLGKNKKELELLKNKLSNLN